MNPDSKAKRHVQLANAWFAKGKLQHASSGYQQAIDVDINCSSAYFGLGRVALYSGQHEKALAHFERALKLDPDNYKLQIFCDTIYEQQREVDRRERPFATPSVQITQSPPNLSPKLRLDNEFTLGYHRSGWPFALQALRPLHNPNGILFDGAVEHNFLYRHQDGAARSAALVKGLKGTGMWAQWATAEEMGIIPYREPWVGFIHHTPNMPDEIAHYPHFSLQRMLAKPVWQESLASCIGLFTLSEYNACWIQEQTGKPVSAVSHPTEIPDVQFDFERFQQNQSRKIIQIGWWMRRLNAIYRLPLPKENALGYTKIWLVPQYNLNTIHGLMRIERQLDHQQGRPETNASYLENTQEMAYAPKDTYDELLSENVVLIELYDSSANNTVVECIARATPLLVNPLPAVVEYLGADYPLYFNNLSEAAEKALDLDLIEKAHNYLKVCPTRAKLDAQYFLESVAKSEVYRLIP